MSGAHDDPDEPVLHRRTPEEASAHLAMQVVEARNERDAIERQLGIEQTLHAAAIRRADAAEARLRLLGSVVTALVGA
jgi:hypothetical protein